MKPGDQALVILVCIVFYPAVEWNWWSLLCTGFGEVNSVCCSYFRDKENKAQRSLNISGRGTTCNGACQLSLVTGNFYYYICDDSWGFFACGPVSHFWTFNFVLPQMLASTCYSSLFFYLVSTFLLVLVFLIRASSSFDKFVQNSQVYITGICKYWCHLYGRGLLEKEVSKTDGQS